MAITMDFYVNFTKRLNSTKRPVEGGIVAKHTLTGVLKDPCSIMNPVIDIQNIPVQNAPSVMTYAYIPSFERYYFVKDWVWNDGLWTVYLNVDTLASYKNHIGDTFAYIERCAGVAQGQPGPYYDGTIIDKMYPAKNQFVTQNQVITAPWSTGWNIDDGTYILGVISGASSTNVGGAVHYYAMTQTQINNLLNYLMSDTFFDNIGFPNSSQSTAQLTHDVAKSIINPIQYITSCYWFPIDVSDITSTTDVSINVGPWTTIGTGKPLTSRVGYRQSYTLTLPIHPQSISRGAYLNYAPYTRFTCSIAPFGSFQIDPSYVPANREVVLTIQVDGITGKACLQIARNDQTQGLVDFFFETTAMFGVPIQLAQMASDYIGAIKTGLSGLTGTAVAGAAFGSGGAGLAFLGTVGSVLSELAPAVTSEGVNGSFIAFERLIGHYDRLTSRFVYIVDEDNAEMGRPLCGVRQINTLAGFIKCGEATVDFNAFDEEITMIHNHMLQGFFWE